MVKFVVQHEETKKRDQEGVFVQMGPSGILHQGGEFMNVWEESTLHQTKSSIGNSTSTGGRRYVRFREEYRKRLSERMKQHELKRAL